MAFESGNIPKETLDYLAAKKTEQRKGPALFLLIFLIVIVCVYFIFSGNKSSSTAVVAIKAPLSNLPAENAPYDAKADIAEAKKYMAAKDYEGVMMELDFLHPDDLKVHAVQAMYAKASSEKAKKVRRAYAVEYERGLLEAGEDATVRAESADNVTLTITYIFVNRPFVYKIENDADLNAQWRKLGFRNIRLTDGFDSSWSYKLN